MAQQVFVSYSHKDGSFIRILKQKLKEAGFDVWIDQELLRPGQDWRDEIDNAIRASFAVLAVMTPQAYKSQYVTYEWAFALGIGKQVIPILLEKTKVHPRLESLQYSDFTDHWELQDDEIWENKLLRPLKQILGETQGIPLPVPPYIHRAVTALDSYEPQDRAIAVESLGYSDHPAAIEALAEAVHHHLPDVRIRSALKLAIVSNYSDLRAVSGLIEGLNDEQLREEAAEALGQLHDPSSIPSLVQALEYLPGYISASESNVVQALVKMGESAVEPLLKILKDAEKYHEATLQRVIRILGEIGDYRAVPELVTLITHEHPKVVEAAILYLGVLKAIASVPHLIQVLVADDWWGRLDFVALGRFTDNSERKKEQLRKIQRAAYQSLLMLGTPEAKIAAEKWITEQEKEAENRTKPKQK